METVSGPHSDVSNYPLFEPEKLEKISEFCQLLTENISTNNTRLISSFDGLSLA